MKSPQGYPDNVRSPMTHKYTSQYSVMSLYNFGLSYIFINLKSKFFDCNKANGSCNLLISHQSDSKSSFTIVRNLTETTIAQLPPTGSLYHVDLRGKSRSQCRTNGTR